MKTSKTYKPEYTQPKGGETIRTGLSMFTCDR